MNFIFFSMNPSVLPTLAYVKCPNGMSPLRFCWMRVWCLLLALVIHPLLVTLPPSVDIYWTSYRVDNPVAPPPRPSSWVQLNMCLHSPMDSRRPPTNQHVQISIWTQCQASGRDLPIKTKTQTITSSRICPYGSIHSASISGKLLSCH